MPPKPITAKQLRALANSFPWKDWNDDLAEGFTQPYRDLVLIEGQKAAEAAGVEFNADDPFLQKHITSYVSERIVQLSKTTQNDVKKVLRTALAGADENLSPAQLQEQILDAVRQKFDDYEAFRALRIARTESAIAYNHGGVLGGIQAGFEEFDVYDGTDDEECAAADGSVWTADQCLENPIAHPNCVRSFGPHVDEASEAA